MRKTYTFLVAAGFAASLSLGACGGKPSKEECEKFADHFADLMTKGQEGPAAEIAKSVADGMKPELVKECTEKGNKAEIDCAMKADTMEALEKCAGDKAK